MTLAERERACMRAVERLGRRETAHEHRVEARHSSTTQHPYALQHAQQHPYAQQARASHAQQPYASSPQQQHGQQHAQQHGQARAPQPYASLPQQQHGQQHAQQHGQAHGQQPYASPLPHSPPQHYASPQQQQGALTTIACLAEHASKSKPLAIAVLGAANPTGALLLARRLSFPWASIRCSRI
ncbi:hypothetical protein FOA52_009573 [Chlamydomonas sp. UWO 241]|nr:hypothetical protein FOA52_009573 [Chlamydomonas sp. UWO 241]